MLEREKILESGLAIFGLGLVGSLVYEVTRGCFRKFENIRDVRQMRVEQFINGGMYGGIVVGMLMTCDPLYSRMITMSRRRL